jgi:hypothetical protein
VSQVRRKKQDEAEFVNDLQYNKPKKKRKKSGSVLTNLQAFGVFTDQGIQISCAGCPSGWPEMLTVYPEYEVGIPVTCSNCPNNWPGALNLLGMGGDQSWQQSGDGADVGGRGRGRGNTFFAFDASSNFGGRSGADFGNAFGGADQWHSGDNFGGTDRGRLDDKENGADTPPPSRRPENEDTSTEAPTEPTTTEEFILPEDRTTTQGFFNFLVLCVIFFVVNVVR